jgi:hypothetical protein
LLALCLGSWPYSFPNILALCLYTCLLWDHNPNPNPN